MRTRFFTLTLVLVFFGGFSAPVRAQPDDDPRARSHAGIDSVYARMSAAYDSLNLDAIANLYTEDAVYLPSDEEEALLHGREAVRDNFSDFFAQVKASGNQIGISFRVVKREVVDDVAYDAGYYQVDFTRPDGTSGTSTGKFATVLRRFDDGTWRFAVDAFSDAPEAAYDLATPIR